MKRILIRSLFFIFIVFPMVGNTGPENASLDLEANSTVNLNDRDKYSVVDLHNRVRCQLQVPATTMPGMVWNERLYLVAQNHANKCVFEHNANRSHLI